MRGRPCQVKGALDETTSNKPLSVGEKLFLYLAVSNTAISSALIREERNVQKPVYYTSQAFQGVEASYPRMEKIAFDV